jgi:hypothetical protein
MKAGYRIYGITCCVTHLYFQINHEQSVEECDATKLNSKSIVDNINKKIARKGQL